MVHKTSFFQKIALVILSVFIFLILIEAGLRISGFVILSLQERRNMAALMQRGEYLILCLGESTTQGQYPKFLQEELNRRNTGIRFTVIDKGVTGTNTSIILSGLESDISEYLPDMVITMMGINDSGPYMPYGPVSDSKAANFFKSFRIYKLVRILRLNIMAGINKRTYGREKNKLEDGAAHAGPADFRNEADGAYLSHYSSTTAGNYNKLKNVLDKRNIVYVCSQYPMRDLGPLKRVFKGDVDGIVFVDNEAIFKNAVDKEGYQNYFKDSFGGDFGHCTDKGNRLLAQNIADAVLKEILIKKIQ